MIYQDRPSIRQHGNLHPSMDQTQPAIDTAARRTPDWPRLLHWLVLAVCAAWIAGYFLPPINHDTAVLLYIAKSWLGGGQLYVDMIDINTPLVFVLHLLPEAIAAITGIPGTTVL